MMRSKKALVGISPHKMISAPMVLVVTLLAFVASSSAFSPPPLPFSGRLPGSLSHVPATPVVQTSAAARSPMLQRRDVCLPPLRMSSQPDPEKGSDFSRALRKWQEENPEAYKKVQLFWFALVVFVACYPGEFFLRFNGSN
mmetsp:Transcript_25747/g.59742  ORF Transcript_25747/g.59742 Transcript_25747/m.59742 type:complete len:141 (-) Transcript_25747:107-529(-)